MNLIYFVKLTSIATFKDYTYLDFYHSTCTNKTKLLFV